MSLLPFYCTLEVLSIIMFLRYDLRYFKVILLESDVCAMVFDNCIIEYKFLLILHAK